MRYGMTYEEMMYWADKMGWKMLREKIASEDGESWWEVYFQMNAEHGMVIVLVDGEIDQMERFGMWDYEE